MPLSSGIIRESEVDVVVNLLNSGFSEEICDWHSRHPTVAMHFFWDNEE